MTQAEFQPPLFPDESPWDDLHGAIARQTEAQLDTAATVALHKINGDPSIPSQIGSYDTFRYEVLAGSNIDTSSTWFVQLEETVRGLSNFGSYLGKSELAKTKVTPSALDEDTARKVMMFKGLGVVLNATTLGFNTQPTEASERTSNYDSAETIAKLLLPQPSASEPEKMLGQKAEEAFTTLLADMIGLVETYKKPGETTTGLVQKARDNIARQLGHEPKRAKQTIDRKLKNKAHDILIARTPKQLGKTATKPN